MLIYGITNGGKCAVGKEKSTWTLHSALELNKKYNNESYSRECWHVSRGGEKMWSPIAGPDSTANW